MLLSRLTSFVAATVTAIVMAGAAHAVPIAGLYSTGVNSRLDTPIEDAAIYENVFEKIDETVFIRLAIGNDKIPSTDDDASETAPSEE